MLVLYITCPQRMEEKEGKRQRKLNYVPTIGKDDLQLTLSSTKSLKHKIQIYYNSGLISYGAYGTVFKNYTEKSDYIV